MMMTEDEGTHQQLRCASCDRLVGDVNPEDLDCAGSQILSLN